MSHYEDEAQVEQLKRWWNENWKALVGGLALGLGSIFGWQAWQGQQGRHGADASQMYEDLKKAAEAGKSDEVQQIAQKLISQYANTPYAVQGVLRQAQLETEQGKFDEAGTHLNWAAEHTDDEGLRHIARLRQARVLWQQKKADEALALLEPKDPGSFDALYQELRGDIKLSKGDRAGAAVAYRKALDAASDAPQANKEGLRHKLDDLADVAKAS